MLKRKKKLGGKGKKPSGCPAEFVPGAVDTSHCGRMESDYPTLCKSLSVTSCLTTGPLPPGFDCLIVLE